MVKDDCNSDCTYCAKNKTAIDRPALIAKLKRAHLAIEMALETCQKPDNDNADIPLLVCHIASANSFLYEAARKTGQKF